MKEAKEVLFDVLSKIDDKYFERKERDFAYEIYHQLRLIKWKENVEVTCETSKKRFSFDDEILKNPLIRRNFFRDEVNETRQIFRYPDLLIHDYYTLNQQLLAIEIKKSFNGEMIKRDLAKLVVYCKGSLKYKKGILIIVNPAAQRIKNLIEIPDIRKVLEDFPEIEIWVVKPNELPIIYCSTNI